MGKEPPSIEYLEGRCSLHFAFPALSPRGYVILTYINRHSRVHSSPMMRFVPAEVSISGASWPPHLRRDYPPIDSGILPSV